MLKYPDVKIQIFAKAPIPGQVKTRLKPTLSDDDCAALQSKLIDHTLNMAVSSMLAPVELWCSPDCTHQEILGLANKFNTPLKQQSGIDLGERMHNAINCGLQDAAYIILIGTDCPAMDSSYLDNAIQLLIDSADIVIGPAEDGGYVLLGARCIEQTVFSNINWGSHDVLEHTKKNLRMTQLSFTQLSPLWDLDRPNDLIKLKNMAGFRQTVLLDLPFL